MLNNQNGVENPAENHQSLKPNNKYLYIRIFCIQWAFLMASGIFGYFFIGDLVQGKCLIYIWLQITSELFKK